LWWEQKSVTIDDRRSAGWDGATTRILPAGSLGKLEEEETSISRLKLLVHYDSCDLEIAVLGVGVFDCLKY
jgi:hypothetical protein